MKLTFASLLILSLVLSSSFMESARASSTSLNCNDKCGARCAKAGYKERCMTYCGICCEKCNCVPSGTYGNKSECPCYRDMLNSQGKPKCP